MKKLIFIFLMLVLMSCKSHKELYYVFTPEEEKIFFWNPKRVFFDPLPDKSCQCRQEIVQFDTVNFLKNSTDTIAVYVKTKLVRVDSIDPENSEDFERKVQEYGYTTFFHPLRKESIEYSFVKTGESAYNINLYKDKEHFFLVYDHDYVENIEQVEIYGFNYTDVYYFKIDRMYFLPGIGILKEINGYTQKDTIVRIN